MDTLDLSVRHEKADFERWLNQPFSLRGADGPIEVKLTLDEILSHPEQVIKRRKNIRRFPFTLEFLGPAEPVLDSNFYVLTAADSETSFNLYVKPLEVIEDQDIAVYESVVN